MKQDLKDTLKSKNTSQRLKRLWQVLLVTLMLVTLIACGETTPVNPTPTPNPTPVDPTPAGNKADYATFSNSLPGWDAFSVPKADTNPTKLTGAPLDNAPAKQNQTIGQQQYACITTPFSLTKTPDKIVTFDPDAGILYPGSLIQGKGHILGIGSLKELPIRQRAPLTLSINILNNNNTEVVQNPDGASVQAAIGRLIANAETAGLVGGSKATYSEKVTHSVDQAALELGFSARYMSGSASGSLAASRSLDKTTITASFIQNLFTVSIVTPQTPDDWFSNAFSQDILDEQKRLGNIGSDNIPVYVANVVYGRVLNFSFTSTKNESEIRAALSAAYEGGVAGGSVSLTGAQKKLLEEAEINIAQVGGSSSQVEGLIKAGNIKAYFEGDTALTSALPISYTLRNVGDNSIAKVAETTKYNVTECTVTDVEKAIIGERVKVTLLNVLLADPGDGSDGDIYGEFKINGKIKTIPEVERLKGTSLPLNMTFEKTFLYGSSDEIVITGFLRDDDFNGDDDIGEWGIRYKPVFSANGTPGVGKPFVGAAYTVPLYATTNKDRSKPDGDSTLFWKIEKVKDIREGDVLNLP